MKRICLLFALVATSVFQSNAQTSIPFYGFELSNYEVGDTLEYEVSAGSCTGNNVLVIWDKQTIGTDTTVYSIRIVDQHYCVGAPFVYEIIDTFESFISNDMVLGNSNNVLAKYLIEFDTMFIGSVNYDTVNGFKHLAATLSGFEVAYVYDALENLGLVNYVFASSDPSTMGYSYTLIYANLEHYGTYGTYEPIYLSTPQPEIENPLVEYNASTKSLQLKFGSQQFETLQLFDVSGRCVLITGPTTKAISVNHLSTGLYFYQLVGKQPSNGKIFVR